MFAAPFRKEKSVPLNPFARRRLELARELIPTFVDAWTDVFGRNEDDQYDALVAESRGNANDDRSRSCSSNSRSHCQLKAGPSSGRSMQHGAGSRMLERMPRTSSAPRSGNHVDAQNVKRSENAWRKCSAIGRARGDSRIRSRKRGGSGRRADAPTENETRRNDRESVVHC